MCGMKLDWAQYLGDSPKLVTSTLACTFASGDIMFSFGGIGATHDDHTRACAAAAAGTELHLHPDAEVTSRAFKYFSTHCRPWKQTVSVGPYFPNLSVWAAFK